MRKLRERLTYANVMSTLAVFMFLASGTAYASHLIVRSSDVVNNSLKGVDIKERTLGQVPAAALGGTGRSAASAGFCDPTNANYIRCVEVQLDLPRPARVLLDGRITATTNDGVTKGLGICRWAGVVQSGDVLTTVEMDFQDMSLVSLTNVLPAGQGYTFAIECRETGSPGQGVSYRDAWITAVAISPA